MHALPKMWTQQEPHRTSCSPDYFFNDKINGKPHWQEICKYTLQVQGLDVGWPRRPLGQLDDANKKKVEKLLADM